MAIPNVDELLLPMLQLASDGAEHSYSGCEAFLAARFKLTPDELAELLPSGKQTRLKNRMGWAKAHLTRAQVLRSGRPGHFAITDRGRELLAEKPAALDTSALQRYPEFEAAWSGSTAATDTVAGAVAATNGSQTPEEQIDASVRALRTKLADELLERIRVASPAFFEQLVVEVLVAMGYGGSRKDAGQAVGRSGDEGIDGIIKEDRLGLDAIYVQAKRWKDGNNVGRPGVQAFVGSLEGHRARKGVFITASDFSADAREYVGKIEKRVVLISGRELAELMIDHDVGVTKSETYVVRKLDNDYFDESE